MQNPETIYHRLTVDRVFIDLTGSLDGALFLSYLFDHHQQAGGNWFIITKEQCQQATGLKRAKQETLCNQLMAEQLLDKKVAGLPASTHYRLNVNALQTKAHQIEQEKQAMITYQTGDLP